jgi:hypothetical protein
MNLKREGERWNATVIMSCYGNFINIELEAEEKEREKEEERGVKLGESDDDNALIGF